MRSWASELVQDYHSKAQTVLTLLGTAYGVLVHQVAMHCYERGALMARLWNMLTALMDAENASLEQHAQVSFMQSWDPMLLFFLLLLSFLCFTSVPRCCVRYFCGSSHTLLLIAALSLP